MPKIIALDHGGVLDGMPTNGRPTVKDIVPNPDPDFQGYYIGLKDGVEMVKKLNFLVNNLGYKFAFHSKNKQADQERIYNEVNAACQQQGVFLPKPVAMPVYDPELYPGVLSTAPQIFKNDQGITIIAYGNNEGLDGKTCVRNALTAFFNIQEDQRQQCFIFDDGETIINQAKADGYQAFHIDGDNTLAKAINSLYQQELQGYACPENLDLNDEKQHEAIANHYCQQVIPNLTTPQEISFLMTAIGIGFGNLAGHAPDLSLLRQRDNNLTFRSSRAYRETNDSEQIAKACKERAKQLVLDIKQQNDGELVLNHTDNAVFEAIFAARHKRFSTTFSGKDEESLAWFAEQFKAKQLEIVP